MPKPVVHACIILGRNALADLPSAPSLRKSTVGLIRSFTIPRY